jgi:hypothetical protein
MNIRLIGSYKDLFENNLLRNLDYDTMIGKIDGVSDYSSINNNINIKTIIDFIVNIDGLRPQSIALGSNSNINGYPSKSNTYGRQFTFNTIPLFNHKKDDIIINNLLDQWYIYPYKYFTL